MGDISKVVYAEKKTKGGSDVYLVERGSVTAEDIAMLQALNSRSDAGFLKHLERLKSADSGKFMERFYVGFGHKSIGDCGDTTIFLENVSLLAAKAIQDFPLYRGQETSTRYLDFSKRRLIDPTASEDTRETLEKQRRFYLSLLEPTRENLKKMHQIKPGEDQKVYEDTIKARAFDITRGFLPAGVSTNLSWSSDLRHLADRLIFLRHHPLTEVRDIALSIEEAATEIYPHSFTARRYLEEELYQDLIAENYFYHDPNASIFSLKNNIDPADIEKNRPLFSQRPKKAELPKFLAQLGNFTVKYMLDFGSWRDIHRHRALIHRMPLLTSEIGFAEWYLENLPEQCNEAARKHLSTIESETGRLGLSQRNAQYILPISYKTSNQFSGDLPAIIYLVEQRDSRFVHPTLQFLAHKIGKTISEEMNIPFHVDSEPGRFDTKRGLQNIVEK